MIDSEITLKKLEIFLTFMAQENIGRAAEQLGLSNVSVHRALHTLEEGLGCPLFIHKGRNLLPLPAAQTMAEYAREIVGLTYKGIEKTRLTAGVGQQHMRIGTLYSLTLETVPRLIMGLTQRRPGMEINLIMGSNEDLLVQLENQQLDAILISVSDSQVDPLRFETLPLFEDDIFLAAPVSSPLNNRGMADLQDFRNQKFVSLTEGFATYHGFSEAFHIAGFEPEIVTRVNDIFSMLSLVQAGVGYTLVPGRMRTMYQHTLTLIPLCERYQMRQTIALVLNHNQQRDPNLLALVAEGRMYARSEGVA